MFTSRLLNVLALASLAVAWVEFDPELIPQLDEPLPVYGLGDPAFLPDHWVEAIAGNAGHGGGKLSKRDNYGDSKVYIYDGETIIGYVDKGTGETQIFPDYTKLQPARKPLDIVKALEEFGGGHDAIPPDDTLVEVLKGSTLVGNTVNNNSEGSGSIKEGSGTEGSGAKEGSGGHEGSGSEVTHGGDTESTYLATGYVQRLVECTGKKIPVCGPGSRATFGVNGQNRIISLNWRWKPAKKTGQYIKPWDREYFIKHVKQALEAKAVESNGIKIYHVDACYYDSGDSFLQPVYRVFGETYAQEKNKTTDTFRLLKYYPIGEGSPESTEEGHSSDVEAIEYPADANQQPGGTGASQVARSLNYFDARSTLRQRGIKTNVTVGRYVTRNDTVYQGEFLANANGFWNNLANTSPSPVNFINSQYYWAEPRLYGTEANTFVNSVNLVLTESHGAYHLFSTYADSGSFEAVSVPSGLLAGGYGPNNGGALAYWIVNACEFIPARIDFPTLSDADSRARAFDTWWPVFAGGLHAVLGWRTSPFFADNVAVNTAKQIALGLPIASAWLYNAHNDPAFAGKPMYVGHGNGVLQPNGRATTVYPCGHGSDTILQLQGLGKPSCLEMRYWNND
ncbi:hypothetical protein D9611_002824 [Ephemerocybe angulata]|uniref:Uncharacterized protein n=1 Tax=Ephemerocybe angulata TaxID=980116 RepID=A0A8H5C3F2_9AGAR|nr:hypothetical protein D9611_002824 [Tulosesus angulatus]